MLRKFSIVFLVLLLTSLGFYFFKSKSKNLNIPVIFWVWERPENLYFVKDKNISFAYLAGTVTKTDKNLEYYSRRQPLRIPDESETISVIRIEDRSKNHVFEDKYLSEISDYIVKSCREKTSNIACQIDFDASESQIEFYKKLVVSVREKLPKEMKLSLTALVSWCVNDKAWFDELPIDEAVPMFFRLGREENIYWQRISEGRLNISKSCQKAVGVATDEPMPNKIYTKDKPIYIFNNDYWTAENWDIMKLEIQKIYE